MDVCEGMGATNVIGMDVSMRKYAPIPCSSSRASMQTSWSFSMASIMLRKRRLLFNSVRRDDKLLDREIRAFHFSVDYLTARRGRRCPSASGKGGCPGTTRRCDSRTCSHGRGRTLLWDGEGTHTAFTYSQHNNDNKNATHPQLLSSEECSSGAQKASVPIFSTDSPEGVRGRSRERPRSTICHVVWLVIGVGYTCMTNTYHKEPLGCSPTLAIRRPCASALNMMLPQLRSRCRMGRSCR